MATRDDIYRDIQIREGLREQLADRQAAVRPGDTGATEIWTGRIADLEEMQNRAADAQAPPLDGGLAELVGLGQEAVADLGAVPVPRGVSAYDDALASERLLSAADLYYLFQHEVLGVFRAVNRLHALYQAGTVRLTDGEGAFRLYRWDRRRVLRATRNERHQAYRRVFGYTSAPPPDGARPNEPFHPLFERFNREVAGYFRDQRISEVIRQGGQAGTFGSVPVVRRAGLDLRENLRGASYGHVNTLSAEMMQLLHDAFAILGAQDVRSLFGADTPWDTFEDVMRRYEHVEPPTSVRSRMATAGRAVLQWLAQPHILNPNPREFELLLNGIGSLCEEWLTAATSLRSAQPRAAGSATVVPLRRRA